MSNHIPKPLTSNQRGYIINRLTADIELGKVYKDGKEVGSRQKAGYYVIWVFNRLVYRHHLIWFFANGSWPSNTVDHDNRIRGDDCATNLIVRSQQAQMANITKKSDLPTGVSYEPRVSSIRPYTCRIYIGGRQQYLGSFPTPEEAHEAYSAKRKQILGLVESGEIIPDSPGSGSFDDE